ncbi:HNH endonuclease signature motif containing protein [Myroides sp. LJL116]
MAESGTYPTKYHEISKEELAILRNEFDKSGGVRENFLKEIAKDPNAVKKYGTDIVNQLKDGKVPNDYVVHHKKPLFRGGTNESNNLTLIDKKYHRDNNKVLHWYEEGENPYGLND